MATGRVLKKLFAMSALAGALLIAAPVEARDRDHGYRDGYSHYDRHGGHGWGGHYRERHHGGHHDRHWGHHGGYYGHGWGYYAPRYYAPSGYYHQYHRHHRGCGHVGYHDDALVHFLVDYARYD